MLEISPDYSWAYFNLASIDYDEGNLQSAVQNLEKIANALDIELNILFRYSQNKSNSEIIDNINNELTKLNGDKLEKVLLFIEDFIL